MEKIDKRKFNGGNSTKTNGADKRKNEYRTALEQAATVEDVIQVIKMVHTKAVSKQDIKAAQLFLEYYLGKPNQSIDINSSEGFNINFNELFKFKE
jgi:hypothetical protein